VKRTPLKRKTPLKSGGSSLSRGKPKASPRAKKKPKITTEKKKAWAVFSRYIRRRGAWEQDGVWVNQCVTCKAIRGITGKGCLQAGHFIPGRGNAVLYDERCVHPQCYVCNVRESGRWVEYDEFMRDRYGEELVAEIKGLRFAVMKRTAEDHIEIRKEFEAKLESVGGWPEGA